MAIPLACCPRGVEAVKDAHFLIQTRYGRQEGPLSKAPESKAWNEMGVGGVIRISMRDGRTKGLVGADP